MTTQDLKLSMIQSILEIQEPDLLQRAAKVLQKMLNGISVQEEEDEEFDANKMSFEEWNKQFIDGQPLDEFVPEHGMTLGAFRKQIYEAERSEERPIEEFFDFLDKRIDGLKTKNLV